MDIISVIIWSTFTLSTYITCLPSTTSCWPDNWWSGCCRNCNFPTQQGSSLYPQQLYQYPYQQQQQQWYPPLSRYTPPQTLTRPHHYQLFDPRDVSKQYILDARKVSNRIYEPKHENKEELYTSENKLAGFQNDSPAPLETIRHNPENIPQEKMKISPEVINDIENEEVRESVKNILWVYS